MQATTALALFSGLCAVALAGCSSEIPGETREPRCEPRSHTAPGRLNIDTGAEHHGVTEPCRARVEIYIARNTPLRAVEARISFSDRAGETIGDETVRSRFGDAESGLFADEMALSPVEGHRCHDLAGRITKLACREEHGELIDCPAVRLKTSHVFDDFTIDEEGLDVCFD